MVRFTPLTSLIASLGIIALTACNADSAPTNPDIEHRECGLQHDRYAHMLG
jgi:hypothetical protein